MTTNEEVKNLMYSFSLQLLYYVYYTNHGFLLQITDLQHSVLSPLSFRLEYKRGATTTPTMFQRQVRMQVNINDISEGNDGGSSMAVHAITFTLLSGIVYTLYVHYMYFLF